MTQAPIDRRVRANGLDLHYMDWAGSAGAPAILLHGFALNCHSWDEVAPGLRSRLRLLAFDQRGHGLSDRAKRVEDYTRENMVADLDCVIRELGLERPVVIGHSMGGMNALDFAARHPERVRALVLVDVGPEVSVDGAREVGAFVAGPYQLDSLDEWVEHTHRYYPWRSKERIRARLAVSLRETPDGKLAKQYDERFRDGFGGIARSSVDALAASRALRCPTLLVHGGSSPVLTREMAERFASAVECVELVSIPGASHSVAGDRPEEFVKVVGAFLDSVLGSPA
ncbi:MAG: alpha/beta hydrolase [Deltaproteobacteria bacterium]|nr:alpha/beta hydrolase [Deltaproteobacteria bacterium]